jgi:biotin operon repressor/anti-sigma regulatory factor (Ser/Thr protein kinase)
MLTKSYSKYMDTKQKILNYIITEGESSGAEIARNLTISRQAVNRHIRTLAEEGLLIREGNTRGTRYHVQSNHSSNKIPSYRRCFLTEGLEEDRVFNEIHHRLDLSHAVSGNCLQIVQYAFTEILNNAIDHAKSRKVDIQLDIQQYSLQFSIRDFGIGIFSNIANSFKLKSEFDALSWVMKGKKTTMPDRHTGEGLFFTTKVGDTVSIRSHKISVDFLNSKQDIYTGEQSSLKGTEVYFSIKRKTRKSLKAIFDEYAPEEYEYRFNRTRVYIKLSQKSYMSRSEGKRLVTGLEKFREVVFDFKGVASIGQAFCDEVFRIYPMNNKNIAISVEHANPVIMQMLKHVGVDNIIT